MALAVAGGRSDQWRDHRRLLGPMADDGSRHDGDQEEDAAPHRQVGDVGPPERVRPLDGQAPQQAGPDIALGMRLRGLRPLVHVPHADLRHQWPHPFASDLVALPAQLPGRPARPVPSGLRERLFDQPHQRQVQRALARRRAADRRPADRQQPALPRDRRPRVSGIDHLSPPRRARRPLAGALEPVARTRSPFREKSRSTISSPIFACRRPGSASRSAAAASARPGNTVDMPSTACRFRVVISVRRTPCFATSAAAARSPYSASGPALALNSALWRRLLPVIRSVLDRRRPKLDRPPGFRGPPLPTVLVRCDVSIYVLFRAA